MNLLEVTNLATCFKSSEREVWAVRDVSFQVAEGETLAIVGESGCGKSITALSLLRLVPPGGRIAGGCVSFDGVDLLQLSEEEMRRVRGAKIAMIFQEPMTSLNPVLTIGTQISEGLILHRGMSKAEAAPESINLLQQVGIPSPAARVRDYPHLLSGGMRQRAMIAMALACRPKLLIADEPTTALDVTIQAQILDLLNEIRESLGMGMILISHDLGIVAENAQRTAIMYAGRIVETAQTSELFANPLHPYTKGLLKSLPQNVEPGTVLPTIPGHVPTLGIEIQGCAFHDRCPERFNQCSIETPDLLEIGPGHMVSCWRHR